MPTKAAKYSSAQVRIWRIWSKYRKRTIQRWKCKIRPSHQQLIKAAIIGNILVGIHEKQNAKYLTVYGYSEDLELIEYDLEQAKEYMAASDQSRRFSAEVVLNSRTPGRCNLWRRSAVRNWCRPWNLTRWSHAYHNIQRTAIMKCSWAAGESNDLDVTHKLISDVPLQTTLVHQMQNEIVWNPEVDELLDKCMCRNGRGNTSVRMKMHSRLSLMNSR